MLLVAAVEWPPVLVLAAWASEEQLGVGEGEDVWHDYFDLKMHLNESLIAEVLKSMRAYQCLLGWVPEHAVCVAHGWWL